MRRVVCMARFMARRKATRRSSCWAMFSANKRCIQLRLADFDNVQHRFGRCHFGQFLAELFNVGPLLADHNAGTCRINRDTALLVRAFNNDPGDAGRFQLFLQELADRQIFMKRSPKLSLPAYQRESHVG